MSINHFDTVRERCEENGVKFATRVDEQQALLIVCFAKEGWDTQMGLDLFMPLEEMIERINWKFDEFLKDVERGSNDVS